MSALLAVLAGAVLMAIAAFVAYALGTKRAIQAQGQPTPAERKIAVEQKAKTDANAATEAARINEVSNATDDDIVRLVRDQLLVDQATAASRRKPPER